MFLLIQADVECLSMNQRSLNSIMFLLIHNYIRVTARTVKAFKLHYVSINSLDPTDDIWNPENL